MVTGGGEWRYGESRWTEVVCEGGEWRWRVEIVSEDGK